MKWANEQSRRLREGFGMAHPDAVASSITRITPETRAAQSAASAVKVYELRRYNSKLAAAEQAAEAKTLAADLRAEFAAAEASALRFSPPATERGRYRLWLALAAKKESNPPQPLIREEEEFWETYQYSSEWKNCKMLHEDFGDTYLEPTGAQAETPAESRTL